jgi:two-component system, sensor histidine kinase PdtaS
MLCFIFNKALALGEKYNDMGTIVSLTISLAHTNLMIKRPREALSIMKSFQSKYHIDHPGVLHELDNRFQSAYLQLKDYEMAAKYTGRIKASLNDMNVNSHTRQASCLGIIGYYLETHVYDSVARYLKVYTTFPATDKLADKAKLHLWWFQVDSAQGRYLSAIKHYQQCRVISDSMYNIEKAKELAEMQVRFDTEKKDHDLDTKERSIQLLTKEKQLQESHLKEAKLLRNITFGGLALMGIIVGLLYNRYRLKQRSNRILEAKQKEINDKNDSLQKLVTEKEWLLKEIHHRVKNNLHIVMSLLNTQSAYLKDEAALQAIQDSQHRVHSMSLIHQKLYQTDNVSAIDMPVYIAELVNYLKESFQGKQYIHFALDVDKIELDVSQAVPIGLILNEAITNAIKYAFPEGRNGHISINMKQKKDNKIVLTIQDDGVGLPDDFDITQTHSLGMSLMQGLSEDVDGGFAIDSDHGTKITIAFVQEQTRHYVA